MNLKQTFLESKMILRTHCLFRPSPWVLKPLLELIERVLSCNKGNVVVPDLMSHFSSKSYKAVNYYISRDIIDPE